MKKLFCLFACLSLVFSPVVQTAVQAENTAKQVNQISDIALGSEGTLKGRAVDGQGTPLNAAKVTVSRNSQVVATVVTAEDGSFAVTGLSTGVYDLRAGQGGGTLRAWDATAAPPSAKKDVLIVSGPVSRAQSGLFVDPAQTITLGLALTGTVLGAVALSDSGQIIYVSGN